MYSCATARVACFDNFLFFSLAKVRKSLANFSTLQLDANTGASDSSTTWTGLAFAGSGGSNEVRWVQSTSTPTATATTASANWPFSTRPASVGVINQAWAFTADTTGNQITTYDGTSAHYAQFRWDWDALGTFSSAPQFSMFGDNTHTVPSAGTQPGGQSGSPIVNGSTDTSNTSYLKANAYGYGYSGSQQTPSANAGGTLAATSGTAGAVSPATGAWLATWQSLQGFVQYIVDGVVPTATTAGNWYFVIALYVGPTMNTGSVLAPCFTFQYNYV